MMKSRLIENLARGRPQRVVVYGTSLSHTGAWVEQAKEAIQAAYPGLLTLINAARSGENSRWGLAHVEESVVQLKPDAVFLEFTINDSVARFEISPAESRQNLENMLDHISSALPKCESILQIMNPVVGKPVGDYSHRRWQSEYQQIYRDVARERNLLLIDHTPAWEAVLARGEDEFIKYVPDGVHPDAQGYARMVTPTILSALGLDDREISRESKHGECLP
jgi:acyl-CoA thioesterase-1